MQHPTAYREASQRLVRTRIRTLSRRWGLGLLLIAGAFLSNRWAGQAGSVLDQLLLWGGLAFSVALGSELVQLRFDLRAEPTAEQGTLIAARRGEGGDEVWLVKVGRRRMRMLNCTGAAGEPLVKQQVALIRTPYSNLVLAAAPAAEPPEGAPLRP